MTNKKFILPAFAGIVIMGLVFVFFPRQAKDTCPAKKIIFGVDVSLISTPVWIAESQGFFREEGLDVRIVDCSSGKTALADMLREKKLDIVTVAQTPVMYNSFSDNNYAIISGIAYSYDDVLMLARRDTGIKTPSDLKGRKIGTPVGSSGHFFLNLFLLYNGLKISDVEILDIDAPCLPRALTGTQVDAIAVWQPHIYDAQKMLSGKAVLLPGKNIYREDFYLVSSKDFIKNNSMALKSLLKAVLKAQNFIQQNKEESIGIVSGRLKLDREMIDEVWDSYQFKLFLDQTIFTDLEVEARWAIGNKYTSKTKLPDYRNFIHTGILESIKPEAVNIIR